MPASTRVILNAHLGTASRRSTSVRRRVAKPSRVQSASFGRCFFFACCSVSCQVACRFSVAAWAMTLRGELILLSAAVLCWDRGLGFVFEQACDSYRFAASARVLLQLVLGVVMRLSVERAPATRCCRVRAMPLAPLMRAALSFGPFVALACARLLALLVSYTASHDPRARVRAPSLQSSRVSTSTAIAEFGFSTIDSF